MSNLREEFNDYCIEHDGCAGCDLEDKEYCHFDWAYQKGRADAIDECINFIKNHSTRAFIDTDGWGCSDYDREEIFRLFCLYDLEQLNNNGQ